MMTDKESIVMTEGNGWHMPPNAKKFHYFENSMSLCSRYGFMKVKGTSDTGDSTTYDCAKCRKVLDKRAAKKEKKDDHNDNK